MHHGRLFHYEEEEGLDNPVIAKKIAKKGKRVLRKDRTCLAQLEEKLSMEIVELAVPILFKKVKMTLFELALLSWKLEDSHKARSQERMKGMMEWRDRRKEEEIADS